MPQRQRSFRGSASFGKRIEYFVIGRMLKENLDVFVPLVDDDGIDAIVYRPDGSTALIQIKARSKDVKFGQAAYFSSIDHPTMRPDYWFVFYSERMDKTWIMTSREFREVSGKFRLKKGNAERCKLFFNGKKADRATRICTEYTLPRYSRFEVADFSRIRDKKDAKKEDGT